MPCYLVIDGKKQEMDEDIFDQMVETLNPKKFQRPPIQTSTRWKPDGTYDSKPLDPEFFPKYYQKNYQHPSSVPTADAPFRPKPMYQNIVKPTFVLTADVIDELLNSNLLNNK
jgi:hypothetical protein